MGLLESVREELKAQGQYGGAERKPRKARAKVNPEIVKAIRELYAEGVSGMVLAKKFNLSPAGAYDIISRKHWKWVA